MLLALLSSIVDIRGLSRLAHQYGALLSVDNTMMSTYLQKVSPDFSQRLSRPTHTLPASV